MQRGRFITLEGGEGTGKSSQARRLAERLRAVGLSIVLTREPGGTTGAEQLRDLLVRGETDRWSPLAETLILGAARADHLQRLIRPALEQGAWVVCDRFLDSTRAYQGAGGGVAPEMIAALEAMVVGDTRPDLTLILDLDPTVGLARAGARSGAEHRFEKKGAAFHALLREGFRTIAAAEPGRCVLIDAAPSLDAVSETVWAAVERLLAGASA